MLLLVISPSIDTCAVQARPPQDRKVAPSDQTIRGVSFFFAADKVNLIAIQVAKLSRIWRKASTTMSPERTWIRAPLFWARAFFTVLIDLLSWGPVLPRLMVRIEG